MNTTLITIFGILFTFVMTTAGAAVVFFFKRQTSNRLRALVLGFSAGIMISASIWSLLLPSLEGAKNWGVWCFIPAVFGFVLGGMFLVILDRFVPNFQPKTLKNAENQPKFAKIFKLFVAITVHNIPEGLAVGFAFGAAASTGEAGAYLTALGLAVGIGIQNFPEGTAVALPIKDMTGSKTNGFLYGMISGAVEPAFACLGYFLAASIVVVQPWILSFSAGAMIFVVVEELIPEAKLSENSYYGTWGVMLGFVVMMILDVVMG